MVPGQKWQRGVAVRLRIFASNNRTLTIPGVDTTVHQVDWPTPGEDDKRLARNHRRIITMQCGDVIIMINIMLADLFVIRAGDPNELFLPCP
jgi:hypothetical protein